MTGRHKEIWLKAKQFHWLKSLKAINYSEIEFYMKVLDEAWSKGEQRTITASMKWKFHFTKDCIYLECPNAAVTLTERKKDYKY